MKTANPCRKNYRPEIDPYFKCVLCGEFLPMFTDMNSFFPFADFVPSLCSQWLLPILPFFN